jgi:hypothetical protein
VYFDLFEAPSPTGEIVGATVRQLVVQPQAIEFKVDATMIQFDVDAILVASNTNALRRFHFFFEVEFTDGTTGDNGLVMLGDILWPDEVVVFTDDGMEVTLPFHWGDDEFVTFTEDAFGIAFAIQQAEFVTLADFAVRYVLDFLATEQVRLSDLSIAWQGVSRWDEVVAVTETMTTVGGNTVALSEHVTISETFTGGPAFIFGDAVFMQEWWTYVMDFQVQPDSVTWTDALVVSEVAATDARPGAFVPGSALLGSPQ